STCAGSALPGLVVSPSRSRIVLLYSYVVRRRSGDRPGAVALQSSTTGIPPVPPVPPGPTAPPSPLKEPPVPATGAVPPTPVVAPLPPPDDAPPDDLVDIGPMLPVHAANAAPASNATDTQGGATLPIENPTHVLARLGYFVKKGDLFAGAGGPAESLGFSPGARLDHLLTRRPVSPPIHQQYDWHFRRYRIQESSARHQRPRASRRGLPGGLRPRSPKHGLTRSRWIDGWIGGHHGSRRQHRRRRGGRIERRRHGRRGGHDGPRRQRRNGRFGWL